MLLKQLTAGLSTPPYFEKGVNEEGKVIFKPNQAIRVANERLLRILYKYFYPRYFPCATGGIKHRSVMNHILPHRKKRFFWKTDIRNCFPSISLTRLTKVLCERIPDFENKEPEVLSFLKEYCSADGYSPAKGFPASTMLVNIYLNELVDKPLLALIRKKGYGLRFTRYIDDYIFSSPMHPIGEEKARVIRAVFETAGLKLNDRKTCYFDLKKEGYKEITGINLFFGGKTGLPGKKRDRIKGMIHLAKQGKVSLEVIHGHMAWFYFVTGGYYSSQERVLQNLYRLLLGQTEVFKR